MGWISLAREVVSLPIQLAPSVGGLVSDATRYAATRIAKKARSVAESGVVHEITDLDLAHHTRRFWRTEGRVHLELREVDVGRQRRYLEALVERLQETDGVRSVTPIPGMGRVVVWFDDEDSTLALILNEAETLEDELDLDDCHFGRVRPDHPADREPLEQSQLLIAADVAGIGLAAAGRLMKLPSAPVPLDVAGLLTVVSYVPWLREALEHRLQTPAAGFGLAAARAISGGLGQQVSGPAIDIVHRASQITAISTRRQAWERLEHELITGYPAAGLDARILREPRPGDLPHGPIEHAALPTTIAAFAGAGVGLLLRPNFDQALSFLVAGSPKAARWGREAHTAHLATMLARRDVLVTDFDALARLDRIDTLVISEDLLLSRAGNRAELELLAAQFLGQAKASGIDVWVAGDDPTRVSRLPVAGVIETGSGAARAIRNMQAEGRGVAVVAAGDHPALHVGDVTLGLRRPGEPVPWHASIVGSESLLDAYVLALAIESAKRNSRQAARLAVAGTGVAGLMTLGGLRPGGLSRVMGAVNVAALIAHLNGMRIAAATARRSMPEPGVRTLYHALPSFEVLQQLGSGYGGLSAEEASRRRIPPPPEPNAVADFFRATGEEMVNPLTPILAAGAGLAAAAGTFSDAVAVASVVGLNAFLGGAQRFRAERATRALTERAKEPVTVLRDGTANTVDLEDIVVGDVVHLQAGDVVPADCRVLSATTLELDESTLTGESLPAAKTQTPVPEDTPVAERSSMLYAGTTIAAGSVRGVVVAMGTHTEAYRGIISVASGPPETGVEQRLEDLTAKVSPVSVSAGLAMVGAGLARGLETSEILGSGVGLAVAAVPEGLPLLATAAQQAAARRLSTRGVIVRNARAIEALGRVDIVCADKTGTLTLGKIRVDSVAGAEANRGQTSDLSNPQRLALATALAATPMPENGRRLAHPTDRALLYAADDAELDWMAELGGFEPQSELPFEPLRGFHASVGFSTNGRWMYVKGAPEVLLPRCSMMTLSSGEVVEMTSERREAVRHSLDDIAHQGLRILLVASRQVDDDFDLSDRSVTDLTFIGSVELTDPVRPTSKEAIADLRSAQIRVLMITGDHPATAQGIAHELGLSIGSGVVTGTEIDLIDDEELARRLSETDVCARVTPAHKVRIVRALRHAGHVVAMTGDGANDAPAIRLADVGIALGTRATDAARSTSDLVVVDDRIETIVAAVVEGRALWVSVRDAIAILVGGNLGEIGFTLAGALPTGISPLNTRQLLLVNLMTDALPAMAIAVSQPTQRSHRELMKEGPDRALGKELDRAITVRAIATGTGAGIGWLSARLTGRRKRAGTVALVSLVGAELGQTLLSGWKSPLVVASSVASFGIMAGVVQIPGLSQVFGCTPLGPLGWMQAVSSATLATAGAAIGPKILGMDSPALPSPTEELARKRHP